MIDFLKNIDTELFLFFNGLHSDFFDFLMWWMSDKYVWIPFYAFLLFLLIKKYKQKSIIPIITITLFVIASDQTTVHLFKNTFQRYRPSQNLDLTGMVHIVNDYKGGLYGFVSSHASNVFGLATLLSLLLKNKTITIILILWAIIVSYSRVYLGVHYPADIACGAIVGFIIAFILYKLSFSLNKRIYKKRRISNVP